MDWILPSNQKYYDVVGAFGVSDLVDWTKSRNMNRVRVGDIAYIYSSKPDSRILFKCRVEMIDVPKDELIDDSAFWRGGASFGDNGKPKVRLRRVAYSDSDALKLNCLREHGIKTQPQSQQRISPELSEYLDIVFGTQGDIAEYAEVDPSETFSEGHCRTVSVNKYERNPAARRKCIEHYGTSCLICGLDLGERYGEYARGFIHVHHLRALHQIAKEYEVDPINDLIPVCPNCHAMIHRLSGGEEMGTEELRKHLFQPR
ncbi:HNH endonuclease [Candidatus Collinsella stercoripullorum]|uniref:HNH endonuclease n=1 Tax=Candidatus Collinsella stercoripullorum TaxID=2838522 RepID=UPI0022DF5CC2|nr:HNH endonuclease [Candidatus Collinsella stercoripullorum]